MYTRWLLRYWHFLVKNKFVSLISGYYHKQEWKILLKRSPILILKQTTINVNKNSKSFDLENFVPLHIQAQRNVFKGTGTARSLEPIGAICFVSNGAKGALALFNLRTCLLAPLIQGKTSLVSNLVNLTSIFLLKACENLQNLKNYLGMPQFPHPFRWAWYCCIEWKFRSDSMHIWQGCWKNPTDIIATTLLTLLLIRAISKYAKNYLENWKKSLK